MSELQRQSPAWTRQTKKGGVLPGFSCRERKNGEGLRALAKFRCLCSRRLRYPLRVCACRQYGEFDRPNGEVRALLVLGNQCLEPRQLLGVRVGKVAVIDRVMNHLVIYKNNTSHLISLPIIQHSGLSVYIDNPYNPALNKAHNHTDWQKRVISN